MESLNQALLSSLAGKDFSVRVFPVAASTNTLLASAARAGAEEFTLFVAESQTAGRGREGRHFFSPAGGAYFSLLVRPEGPFDPALLTALSAVCVCDAAEELGASPCGIKWVNDVYSNGKKCCGILTQGVFEGDRLTSAVIGIGANLTLPEGGFAPEIADRAGAFFCENTPPPREAFIASVCQKIKNRLPLGISAFLNSYRERSILTSRRVLVSSLTGKDSFYATVLGIDSACRLLVSDETGKTHTLSTGEVTLTL